MRDAPKPPEKKPLEPRHYWYSAAALLAFTADYLAWACGAGLVWMPIAPLSVLCITVVSAAVIKGDEYIYVRRDELSQMESTNKTLRDEVNELRSRNYARSR